MSGRTKHDLNIDHRGAFDAPPFADRGSDPGAAAAGTHLLYAKSDGLYVEDPSSVVVGPLGKTPDPPQSELITGDSSNFGSSNGSWTNSGGTLTHDTTVSYKWDSGFGGSLKWATTTSGQYIELPISGTFKSGVEYHALIAVMTEENAWPTSWGFTLGFGLLGTDDSTLTTNTTQVAAAGYGYASFMVRWTPSSDRTGVKLRFTRTDSSTLTFHVGLARAVNTTWVGDPGLALSVNPAGPPFSSSSRQGVGLMVFPNPQSVELRAVTGDSAPNAGGLVFDPAGGVSIQDPTGAASVGPTYRGGVFIHGGVTAGSLNSDGVDIEVGPDYNGIYISEKDAHTTQIYDDYSGYADIELVDLGTRNFKMVNVDGAAAIPSRGMLPQYSAAPSSPAEGWSYYDTTLHKSRTWDGSAWQNWW